MERAAQCGWTTDRGAGHVLIGIGIAIGIALGVGLSLLAVSVFGTTGVRRARRIREQLLEDARREAAAVRREAQVEAREQIVRLRSDVDAELAGRRAQVLQIEERVLARELEVERKLEELSRRDQGLADREAHVRRLQDELKEAKNAQLAELERLGGLTQAEARAESRRRARSLVADALQRVAASHTAETTVTVVELPSDDMKGRIIGREGRNIRTLEHLTGVDFIIDDTPHAVVLSSFDGLRREVARLTVTKLLED